MTIGEALRSATRRLAQAGVSDPGRDARILVAAASGHPADRIRLYESEPCLGLEALEDSLIQREARKPVAMIVGQREFWGRPFKVTTDTLVPRPETEVLVEEALKQPFARVLDLGTGSGAIIVSLLCEIEAATGVGVDVSEPALAVARANAATFDVATRVEMIRSDWFRNVQGKFDLIVSNPPYVSEEEFESLAPEVRNWDPKGALSPGGDGLDAYRRIAKEGHAFLADHGRLLVEIGSTQSDSVTQILAGEGWDVFGTRVDLDGRNRVICARISAQ